MASMSAHAHLPSTLTSSHKLSDAPSYKNVCTNSFDMVDNGDAASNRRLDIDSESLRLTSRQIKSDAIPYTNGCDTVNPQYPKNSLVVASNRGGAEPISRPSKSDATPFKNRRTNETCSANSSDVVDDGGGADSSINININVNLELLKTSYDERLRTFLNCWNVPFLKPEALATAMFYYIGQRDIVRCPHCKVEVGRWENGDDPLIDHQKWSPHCSFIVEQFGLQTDSTTGLNVETSRGPTPAQALTGGHDTCGKFGIIQSRTSIPENSTHSNPLPVGVQQIQQPSYKQFSILEKRLETFTDWPVSIVQKPKELAEAGFFYTGKSDQTVCFHCSGGLKDWESTDVPWQQHAKWFPNCPFVVLQKGMQYVLEQKQSSSSIAEEPTAVVAAPKVEAVAAAPPDATPDSVRCKICLDKEVGVVFLPCGHMVACVDCAPALSNCAVCRAKVDAYVRAFLS